MGLFHGVLLLCVVGQHEFPHNVCIHVASYGYLQIHCAHCVCPHLGLVVDIALYLIDDGAEVSFVVYCCSERGQHDFVGDFLVHMASYRYMQEPLYVLCLYSPWFCCWSRFVFACDFWGSLFHGVVLLCWLSV